MNAFPDTSFLFALYRPQDNSPAAQKYYAAMTERFMCPELETQAAIYTEMS